MDKFFIITSLLVAFLECSSCHSNNQTGTKTTVVNSKIPNKTINSCLISYESDVFKTNFFPFDFENFNTRNLLKYFTISVIVDSIETNSEGYITRDYTFSDKDSKISLFVKINNTNGDNYFYLNKSTIKTDLIKFKNDIRINMSRHDFFKAIKSTWAECDTVTIKEGDMITYYYFIFEDDKLKTIQIVPAD